MKLRKWKEQNRYTSRELADMSGIHESKIKRILLDGYCIRLTDAIAIEKMTCGSVNYLDLQQEVDG